MNITPKAIVVMPCYNAQGTLVQTLDSVIAQSFKDFYIIAVNDGSQDQTGEILADYAQRHPGKLKVVSQINQGQTVAKNLGIREGKSEYIAFLDSDDIWLPDKLEKQVALLDINPNVGMCYTAAEQIDQHGDVVGRINVSISHRGRCHDELIKANNIVASSAVVRRSAVEQAGLFDESFRACENWDLWIRIARNWEVEYVDEPLTSYRVHPDNMSKNFEKMMNARLRVIDKHLPPDSVELQIKTQRTDALFKTHLSFAKGYFEALRLAEARRELGKALKIKPSRIDCYALYLKSLLGPKLFQWVRTRRNDAM